MRITAVFISVYQVACLLFCSTFETEREFAIHCVFIEKNEGHSNWLFLESRHLHVQVSYQEKLLEQCISSGSISDQSNTLVLVVHVSHSNLVFPGFPRSLSIAYTSPQSIIIPGGAR